MKAEDYITEWCDKTYGGGKELGDWTTNEVMKFANDLVRENIKLITNNPSFQITDLEYKKLMKILYPNYKK